MLLNKEKIKRASPVDFEYYAGFGYVSNLSEPPRTRILHMDAYVLLILSAIHICRIFLSPVYLSNIGERFLLQYTALCSISFFLNCLSCDMDPFIVKEGFTQFYLQHRISDLSWSASMNLLFTFLYNLWCFNIHTAILDPFIIASDLDRSTGVLTTTFTCCGSHHLPPAPQIFFSWERVPGNRGVWWGLISSTLGGNIMVDIYVTIPLYVHTTILDHICITSNTDLYLGILNISDPVYIKDPIVGLPILQHPLVVIIGYFWLKCNLLKLYSPNVEKGTPQNYQIYTEIYL